MLKKIIFFLLISQIAFAQRNMFNAGNKTVKNAAVKVVGESVLLIPKGTYTPITTSGSFSFNTSLGGGSVNFTGGDTWSGSSSWGPQQLFDNSRTNYDWCLNGANKFGQFVFPRAVNIKKIFIIPRSQGDSFPTSVILKVDGTTVSTYSTSPSISLADGLGITYSGIGYYIQPNVTGTTLSLEFSGGSYAFIGELEFWGY